MTAVTLGENNVAVFSGIIFIIHRIAKVDS